MPSELKFKNGEIAEVYIRNPYPMFNQLFVTCENTENFQNACSTFVLNKNMQKSNIDNWYGTIQVMTSLDYLKQSVYQFVIAAMVC